jgi:hypothetical protein
MRNIGWVLLATVAGCSGGTTGASDTGALDAVVLADAALDALDTGSVALPDTGIDAGHDGGPDVGPPDATAAGACATLATCCPYVTSPPEFHEGCLAASSAGNATSCAASLAQDCCTGLSQCCSAIADDDMRLSCMEVVSSNDGHTCASSLAGYCP